MPQAKRWNDRKPRTLVRLYDDSRRDPLLNGQWWEAVKNRFNIIFREKMTAKALMKRFSQLQCQQRDVLQRLRNEIEAARGVQHLQATEATEQNEPIECTNSILG